MITIGDRIRRMRRLNNWSQPQLAERCSCTRHKVNHWECNESLPSYGDLFKLCVALKATPNELLGWKP